MLKASHNKNMTKKSKMFSEYSIKDKRDHYKKPTYKKFYSVIRYDRQKFRQYLNYQLDGYKCIRKLSQDDIVKLCYVKDEYGYKYYGDEGSVFRYKALHYQLPKKSKLEAEDDSQQLSLIPMKDYVKVGIHEKLYNELNVQPKRRQKTIEIHGIVCHISDKQAEIKNSWKLPIRQRVRLHIKLLWLLQDYSIKEAMEWLQEVRLWTK